jgi:hypothetical protein
MYITKGRPDQRFPFEIKIIKWVQPKANKRGNIIIKKLLQMQNFIVE